MARGKHKAAADTRRAISESEVVARMRSDFDIERQAWVSERNGLHGQIREMRGRFENDVVEVAAERISVAQAEYEAKLGEERDRLLAAVEMLVDIIQRDEHRMTAEEWAQVLKFTGTSWGELVGSGNRWSRRGGAAAMRSLSAQEITENKKPPTKRDSSFAAAVRDAPSIAAARKPTDVADEDRFPVGE